MAANLTSTESWRPMAGDDLAAVVALAARVHRDYPEEAAIFAEKLALFPRGCFVLGGAAGEIGGYGIAHPWRQGPPPALNTRLERLPAAADTFFIHDVALAPEQRGRGAAGLLLPRLVVLARRLHLDRCALVAVSGSPPFWRRMGFAASPDPVLQAEVRAHYGAEAVHMTQSI